jgi:hypothetical protein
VYYVSSADREIHRLSNGATVNPGAEAYRVPAAPDKLAADEAFFYSGFGRDGDYLICSFRPTETNPYAFFILSPEGKTVYQGGAEGARPIIDGDRFYLLK